MNGYIYKITNDINNKVYIGKTLDTIENRFNEHIKDSRRARCAKRPLYNAMNKYGVDHFRVELVEECSEDILSEREIYWINYFKGYAEGYNATLGGDGKAYIDHDLVLNLVSEGLSAKEIAKRVNCDSGYIITIAKANNMKVKSPTKIESSFYLRRAVLQYDKSGMLIKTYSGVRDAARSLGNEEYYKHIIDVCRNKRKTAYGYI